METRHHDGDPGTARSKGGLVLSVDRAMALLFALETARDMGVTELSKLLGIGKSSVHNLLRTLIHRNIVRQTDTGRYTLGYRVVPLGAAYMENLDVRRIAQPFLEELAAEVNEMVVLALLHNREVSFVAHVVPLRKAFIMPKISSSDSFHSTAVGKTFTAFGDKEILTSALKSPLTRYTPYTITDNKAFAAEIDAVRERGYSIADNEAIEGVKCLAAPVFDAGGTLAAAVSITGTAFWLTGERLDALALRLKKKANAISRELGYKRHFP